jgi:predicted dehydrogenase
MPPPRLLAPGVRRYLCRHAVQRRAQRPNELADRRRIRTVEQAPHQRGADEEAWHPNPAFLYQAGAGPLFDMGPYNLMVLTAVFGPVARVAATARRARAGRTIGAGPRAGQTFPVT